VDLLKIDELANVRMGEDVVTSARPSKLEPEGLDKAPQLGWAVLLEGDIAGARSKFREAAMIARQVGRRYVAADAIWGLAQTAAAAGDPDLAARLGGAAFALGTDAGRDPVALNPFVHHHDDARAALGERAWQKAWADGAVLALDDALGLALRE